MMVSTPRSWGVVVSAAPSAPVVLLVKETDGVKTMSSLDMVAYINATRKPGEATLAHSDFLKKVPQVLGEIVCGKFFSHTNISIGMHGQTRQSPVYNFPRREAIRMAMSYSYDLQATVLDAWDAAEAKLAAQAPPVLFGAPTNYLDALKQLVASVEVNQQQVAPRCVAYARSHQQPRLLCSRATRSPVGRQNDVVSGDCRSD